VNILRITLHNQGVRYVTFVSFWKWGHSTSNVPWSVVCVVTSAWHESFPSLRQCTELWI